MRCLVTGGAGSIGIHVVTHLLQETNWDVVVLDSFRHMGEAPRIMELKNRVPSSWTARLKVVVHDLSAPISEHTRRQIGPVDYIINLASQSDVFASLMNPVPFVQNNVNLILNMLEYAREAKPKAFLQVSTDEVYGPTDGTFLHKEWDAIVPSSPYSASKAAQEAIATSYWRAYGVPLIIVNLMNNFGPMQSPNKFPSIVQRKVSNGETVTIHGTPETEGSRFYIHSSNTANALLFLLRKGDPHRHQDGTMDRPDRFNIPGDAQVANGELARIIADELGLPLSVKYEDFAATRPGHDRHYGLDGSKLHAEGWASPTSFEAGMRTTVRFQMENPSWLK